ncbi:hypothetical protein ARMSODRAFT_103408 [Armillaria solidipes]|uniref:Secreted protein n=1 Tax=Armillaria solidipes TaxID=1076256 RepID=A0A2H3AI84_9AGAR|nr:hypothetical protein ARMSODRAFT_103408 [Armillaria solidipes]
MSLRGQSVWFAMLRLWVRPFLIGTLCQYQHQRLRSRRRLFNFAARAAIKSANQKFTGLTPSDLRDSAHM